MRHVARTVIPTVPGREPDAGKRERGLEKKTRGCIGRYSGRPPELSTVKEQ